jgi:hypothetical protein
VKTSTTTYEHAVWPPHGRLLASREELSVVEAAPAVS